jgi:hypothetical protein
MFLTIDRIIIQWLLMVKNEADECDPKWTYFSNGTEFSNVSYTNIYAVGKQLYF